MRRSVGLAVSGAVALGVGAYYAFDGPPPPVTACAEAPRALIQRADPPPVRSVAWTDARLPDEVTGPADEHIVEVVAFRDGFVAVAASSTGPESHAVILHSPDGVAWRVVVDGRRLAGTDLSALATGRGRVLAAGSTDLDDRGRSRAAIWMSDDGVTWTEGEGPFVDATAMSLAADDDGFLALGVTNADAAPIAWRSRDGASWEREALELPVSLSDAGIGDVAWHARDGWQAVGSIGRGRDGKRAPVLWRSADGGEWSCAVLDAGGARYAGVWNATRSGARWVAIGDASDGCGFGASCPGRQVAWSSDGSGWSDAVAGAGPATDLVPIGAIDGGFLAVGRGAVSVSGDGIGWTALDDRVGIGELEDVAVRSDGRFVAVGSVGGAASTDGLVVVGDLEP